MFATEDLQTVKGKVVDAKRGYNRTLFGFAGRLRCELFSVYLVKVRRWKEGC